MEPDKEVSGYAEKMGQQLGSVFRALSTDLSWVHWRWKQYRILFGEKPARIDLLNHAAPFFFRIVQDVLFEDALLGISRLIGPVGSSGKANLTIRRLPPLCKTKIRGEVERLVSKAVSSAAFAVDWRNRYIAHRDLKVALDETAQLLALATREKVEESLSALRDVLNRIENEYCNADTLYSSPSPWDAESLLYVIRSGLRREKEKQATWNRGERHNDDDDPSEET